MSQMDDAEIKDLLSYPDMTPARRIEWDVTYGLLSYPDMTPARRIEWDVTYGRLDEIGDLLLAYLADHGTDGIDTQALARHVQYRINEETE